MHTAALWTGYIVGGVIAAYLAYLLLLVLWHVARGLGVAILRSSQAFVAAFRGDEERIQQLRAMYDKPPD